VSRVSKPAEGNALEPAWKPAIRQVWKPAPRNLGKFALNRYSCRRGFLLLECLVYIAVLVVVLAVTMRAFYHCWDDSKALRHNADDIIRALHAGEQWRDDLRTAKGPAQLTQADGAEQLRIPSAAGPIIYTFSNGELRRQSSSPAATNVVLSDIESSRMQSEPRQRVTAWTWELELKPTRKGARVRPLFTFETVAAAANPR
jgi:Tfp pilus assembly protein FimT